VYNETQTSTNAACTNCVRRGVSCGVKLPGPKTQFDTAVMEYSQDRSPRALREYSRLFQRIQTLRKEDSLEEIAKLIELVENGTLKEEGNTFVIRGSEEDTEMGFSCMVSVWNS
jgi:hypothetical protein